MHVASTRTSGCQCPLQSPGTTRPGHAALGPRTALRPVLFTSSDPPSHRRIRLGCPGSGRFFVQALPSAIVARIVMADQANCLGCQASVYTHPFVTVRRSLRTRFAIGQRSIFVLFAVKHFQVPQVPRVNVKMWQAVPAVMPNAPNDDIPTRRTVHDSTHSELRYRSLVTMKSTVTNPIRSAADIRAWLRRSELGIPRL